MIVDYFLVRRGNLDIEAMYDESSSGKYYFVYGVNWRAVAAFVAGFALPLPGFIGSFGTASVSSSATYMYDLGWELSFVIGVWSTGFSASCSRSPVRRTVASRLAR